MDQHDIEFKVTPARYKKGGDRDPLFRLSRRLAFQIIRGRRRLVEESGYIPQWFQHFDEVEAALRSQWFALSLSEIEKIVSFYESAMWLCRERAENALADRIREQGREFAEHVLGFIPSQTEEAEPVLREILRSQIHDEKTVLYAAVASMEYPDLAPDILALWKSSDVARSEALAKYAISSNCRAIQEEFISQASPHLLKPSDDSDQAFWFNHLLYFLDPRSFQKAPTAETREKALSLLSQFLDRQTSAHFVESLNTTTLESLAKAGIKSAELSLLTIWKKYGWSGSSDELREPGIVALGGLLRINPQKYLLKVTSEWFSQSSDVAKWRIERLLWEVGECEQSRREIDDVMVL
ncbi:MAG: hypothetical protein AAF357_19095, partial [Verrucomicrobiota bacterium]